MCQNYIDNNELCRSDPGGMLFIVEFSNLASRNLYRNKRLKKFTNINLRYVVLWV